VSGIQGGIEDGKGVKGVEGVELLGRRGGHIFKFTFKFIGAAAPWLVPERPSP
jgi:hypothetical protein